MKRNSLIQLSFTAFLLSHSIYALEYSGRANSWFLYETDDTNSTTVAVVKDESGTLIGLAVGADIATECVPPRTCEYRKIGEGTEDDLERVTGDFANPTRDKVGSVGKDTLLWNLGLDAKGSHQDFAGKIHGDLRTSLLENRQNYGNDKYRARITDLYGEYKKSKYRLRAGRQPIAPGGILLDGVSGDYFLGPEYSKDSKFIGVFAGLSPDPISKDFSADYVSFGSQYRFIPDFSGTTDSKLSIEGALIGQLYKGSMNRFFLSTKIHFTPIKKYSMLLYSNLELPWTGNEDNTMKSSMFSLQNYWRPAKTWFFSLGFTQFRIDRFLQKEAINWVTDGSAQQTRMGESLDRSQRYRADFRASYKPIPEIQPFIKIRYERRSFDGDKTGTNSDDDTASTENLALLNRKNAYQGTFGLKLALVDHLETETSGTYLQRFQSKGYSLYQEASWDSGNNWTADIFAQYVSSERTRDNSEPGAAGVYEGSWDIYAGVGGSYRFYSDFLGQIRYDFGNEDDQGLGRRTTVHTVYLRLDYSF